MQARAEAAETKADAAQVEAQAARTEAQAAQEALISAEAAHKAETDALRQDVSEAREDWASQQASDQVLMEKLSDELQQSRAKAEAVEQELAKKADRPPEIAPVAEETQDVAGERDASNREKAVRAAKSEGGRSSWISDASMGAYVTGVPAVPAIWQAAASPDPISITGAVAAVGATVGAGWVAVRSWRKERNEHKAT
jgi:hypothetical protein